MHFTAPTNKFYSLHWVTSKNRLLLYTKWKAVDLNKNAHGQLPSSAGWLSKMQLCLHSGNQSVYMPLWCIWYYDAMSDLDKVGCKWRKLRVIPQLQLIHSDIFMQLSASLRSSFFPFGNTHSRSRTNRLIRQPCENNPMNIIFFSKPFVQNLARCSLAGPEAALSSIVAFPGGSIQLIELSSWMRRILKHRAQCELRMFFQSIFEDLNYGMDYN